MALTLRPLAPFLAGFTAALLLAGCAGFSGEPVREVLDLDTGMTITSSREHVVFYRDNPSSAAYARNLVELGPIAVNQRGIYRYFLWLGIWNTLATPEDSNERDGFETIVVVADGEPLTLDVAGWTPGAIGASAPVYVKPVANAADAYYPVTLDQIRFMAGARELRLRTTGNAPVEYRLWDGQAEASASLQTFIDSVSY
jgi:hypothetical protein